MCLNYLTPKFANHEQILFLIEISYVILRSLPVGLILRGDVDHPVDRLCFRSFRSFRPSNFHVRSSYAMDTPPQFLASILLRQKR